VSEIVSTVLHVNAVASEAAAIIAAAAPATALLLLLLYSHLMHNHRISLAFLEAAGGDLMTVNFPRMGTCSSKHIGIVAVACLDPVMLMSVQVTCWVSSSSQVQKETR
jgi:hypothetical protein